MRKQTFFCFCNGSAKKYCTYFEIIQHWFKAKHFFLTKMAPSSAKIQLDFCQHKEKKINFALALFFLVNVNNNTIIAYFWQNQKWIHIKIKKTTFLCICNFPYKAGVNKISPISPVFCIFLQMSFIHSVAICLSIYIISLVFDWLVSSVNLWNFSVI